MEGVMVSKYINMNTEELIYAPFTKEEFQQLKEMVREVTNFIPKHHMNLVWESYKRITKSKEPTPCTCKSSAKNSLRALTELCLPSTAAPAAELSPAS